MTTYPLRAIFRSLNLSGHLTKWAVELSEFDIEYRLILLTDFVVELTPDPPMTRDESKEWWMLMVDEASNVKDYGMGVWLKSPDGEVITQSFWLGFKASNNEAEYKALIARL